MHAANEFNSKFHSALPSLFRSHASLLLRAGSVPCVSVQTVSAELQSALDADAELSVAFIGAHLLLSQAIKARVKDRDFSNTLLKEFALAPAYADELCRALAASSAGGQRALLEAAAAAPTIEFPALTQMRWRTDVTISTAALERVFRPTVVMQMTLRCARAYLFLCLKMAISLSGNSAFAASRSIFCQRLFIFYCCGGFYLTLAPPSRLALPVLSPRSATGRSSSSSARPSAFRTCDSRRRWCCATCSRWPNTQRS